MFRANFAWIVTGNEQALDQARVGVKNVLSRVAQPMRGSGSARKSRTRKGAGRPS